MSLWSMIGLGGAESAPQFDAVLPEINSGLQRNLNRDTSAVRNFANTPVTGLSTGGLFQQDYAKNMFNQQRDMLNNQMGSAQATGMANMARYGMDAGAGERLAQGLGRDRMFGAQRLGAQQATTMSDLAAQNVQDQEMKKYTALMALPQLSQSQLSQDFNMNSAIADAQNKKNILNQDARNAAEAQMTNTLGTIGGILGGTYGGPLGGLFGSMGGKALGGLF